MFLFIVLSNNISVMITELLIFIPFPNVCSSILFFSKPRCRKEMASPIRNDLKGKT